MNDRGISEAQMYGRGAGDSVERSIQRRDTVAPRLLGPGLHVGFVELDNVCAGRKQIVHLVIYRLGVVERQLFRLA